MNKQRTGLNSGILDTYLPLTEKQIKEGEKRVENKPIEEFTRIRQTFYVNIKILEKIKDAAWNDRVTVTEVVNEALLKWLEMQEEKMGQPYPSRTSGVKKGRPVR